jgi:hypothetical protein
LDRATIRRDEEKGGGVVFGFNRVDSSGDSVERHIILPPGEGDDIGVRYGVDVASEEPISLEVFDIDRHDSFRGYPCSMEQLLHRTGISNPGGLDEDRLIHAIVLNLCYRGA